MSKTLFFSVACDTDPDINPCCREFDKENNGQIWQGITVGIDVLRQRLKDTDFLSRYKQLPVTWLLRADRQIYELYGNAAFCFQHFEQIWKKELNHGSEIGWHPHLYRWSEHGCGWKSYLGCDDDLEMLKECLRSLRQHMNIYAVRTGWDYHSNGLMNFFDEQGLRVDASAIPGCTHSGTWFYDWRGAMRTPFFPSKQDYRKRGVSPESSLKIIEIPVLVRKLDLPLHVLRYGIRNLRNLRATNGNLHGYLSDWESARWQGMLLTSECRPFSEAIDQTLSTYSESEHAFLTTYFHTGDLLSSRLLERFICNLEILSSRAEKNGYMIVPTTLSTVASLVKR